MIPKTLQYSNPSEVGALVPGTTTPSDQNIMKTCQAFLKALPEGGASLSDDGLLVHCNLKLQQLLGLSALEVGGLPFCNWLSTKDHEHFQQVLHGQGMTMITELTPAHGGAPVPVRISVTRLLVDGLKLIILLVVDLSVYQHLEQERQKFVSLAENSTDFIAFCDQNLTFHYINPHGLGIVGLDSLQHAVTVPLWTLFFTEDQNFIRNQLHARITREGSLDIELRVRHYKSGIQIWMSMNFFSIQSLTSKSVDIACIMREITARKFIENRLRLTSKVFENSLESIIITDSEQHIVEVNNAFCSMTGYNREEVLGKNPRLLKSGDHKPAYYTEMWHSIEQHGHWSGEICNIRKSGDKYNEWLSIFSVRDDEGQVKYYVAQATEINVYKQHQKQLEHLAHYDELTGIPNRVLLTTLLGEALEQCQRNNNLLAICHLDLDNFKSINDKTDIPTGNEMVVCITRRIQQAIRKSDTVARIGGNGFVILILGLEKFEECNYSLQRLLDTIAQPMLFHDQPVTVTASIGVTLFPYDAVDQDGLLHHADQAMQIAKQLGGNRYCFYDKAQEQKIISNFENKEYLLQALQKNEFILYFQPKVELASLRPTGVEALIRWQHPKQGLMTPGQFMCLIEDADLEIEFGEFVIEQSLRQINSWYAKGLIMEISINIAAKHLQTQGFITYLQEALRRYPLLPQGLIQIEVLETAALEDIDSVRHIIESCQNMGISFALDDFGTGYSSLAYLRSIPADTLKIDQTFVRDMLTNGNDLAIVEGVIALAKFFKRQIIAEGVETEEHIHRLRELGCEYGQGYGIAKPMPGEHFPAWFDNWLVKLA